MQSIPILATPAAALPVHGPVAANAVPPCYGVCCHLHGSCANYARVDGADPRQTFMADCGPEYAAFEARVPA